MTETKTPICDLIERLLSRDLSQGHLGQVLETARILEVGLTRGSRSADETRERERLRKADYRARKVGHVPGTETLHIYSKVSNSQKLLRKESKKDSDVPNVPGTNTGQSDGWPPDHVDVFWTNFPRGRKHGKKAVARKLASIRKSGEVSFAKLMLGVTRYAASNPDPQFTKSPEVWLNKGCWDDEIDLFAKKTASRGNGFAAIMLERQAKQQTEGPDEHGTISGH